jgi:hypothetical protein
MQPNTPTPPRDRRQKGEAGASPYSAALQHRTIHTRLNVSADVRTRIETGHYIPVANMSGDGEAAKLLARRMVDATNACAGVEFVGDPSGAVDALITAARGLVSGDHADCDCVPCVELRAALARVRLTEEETQ